MITGKGGAGKTSHRRLPGSAGGTAAVRRTLATTICRILDPMLVTRPRQLRDASAVMRFQPAHQSMINRRYDGRVSGPARNSPKQPLETEPRIHCLLLQMADMRVVRLRNARSGLQCRSPGRGPAEAMERVRSITDEHGGCTSRVADERNWANSATVA